MYNIGTYAKAIVTIIAAGLGILAAAMSDGEVTSTEYVNIGIAIVTAIGVYGLPNVPEKGRAFVKSFVAFGGAALAALVTILSGVLEFGEVSQSDWLLVLLAGLSAIGVYIVPNTKTEVGSYSNDVAADFKIDSAHRDGLRGGEATV